MIVLDLYSHGRLDEFSWDSFLQFLKNAFARPRLTFEDIVGARSALFSLVAVLSVSILWIVRHSAFLLIGGSVPSREAVIFSVIRNSNVGQFFYGILMNLGADLNIVAVSLIVPSMLFVWIVTIIW